MSDTTERDKMFAEASSKRQVEKEAEARKKDNKGYEEVTFGPLQLDKFSSFRILGNAASNRMGDATSPKIIVYSMIAGDDDKRFRCVWPDSPNAEGVGKNWILSKVFNKVMAYKWDSKDNERQYYNKVAHPSIFNRVYKNSRPEILFEKGWYPSKGVAINVIDRTMMDWHQENKKTAIISKKVSESKDHRFFYEPGIPMSIYNAIWDGIVEPYGDWENYDIVIYKTKGDPYYKAYHSVNHYAEFADHKTIPTTFETGDDYLKMADALLTDEERSWERWDLDQRYPVTSYSKIQTKLAIFILQVDQAFGTHFTEELESLVETEKKERKENSNSETSSQQALPAVSDNVFTDDEEESTGEFVDPELAEKAGPVFNDVEDETVEAESEAAPEPRPRPTAKFDWAEFGKTDDGKAMKSLKDMSAEEKAMVKTYNGEKKTFVYQPGIKIFACVSDSCTMASPESFKTCPACGSSLQ